MTYATRGRVDHQQGFILVTSLIFLLVLTLLAVSAINSSTLQERMASNQREKSRSLQAANAGLKHAEMLLDAQDFLECFPLTNPAPKSKCQSPAGNLAATQISIGELKALPGSANTSPDFLRESAWQGSNVLTYKLPESSGNPVMSINYQIDWLPRPSAETKLRFRITSRARGQSPAARAITQSVYEIDR